jgi:hypothetical protein
LAAAADGSVWTLVQCGELDDAKQKGKVMLDGVFLFGAGQFSSQVNLVNSHSGPGGVAQCIRIM